MSNPKGGIKPNFQPDWFDLDLYEPLRTLDRSLLFQAILIRKVFFADAGGATTKYFQSGGKDSFAKFVKDFTGRVLSSELGDTLTPCSVQPVVYKDLIPLLESSTFRLYSKNYNDYKVEIGAELLTEFEGYIEWEGNNLGLSKIKPPGLTKAIKIDFFQTDEKIESDFKLWLKEGRELWQQKEEDNRKRLTENDINKLKQGDVFACMDLLLWAKVMKIKPYTNSQLGDMLYPHQDINRAEKVRKITRPLANYYLSPETINISTIL